MMTDSHGTDAEAVDREGRWAQQAEARLSSRRHQEEIDRGLAFGLEAADSITDRTLPTFARGEIPHFAGERGTFLKTPYVENVHEVGDAEVAIFGAPLDAGTTYRPGTRFGPQGIRRATNLFGTYNYEMGVDLREQLNMVDIGDICTIPGNLEKSFDQISKGIGHVASQGVFPVVLGGDHSIGYPTIRGLAPYVDGNIGIIHFDRHVDTQELDLDERMHTTPWFHATNIPNAPATNLVQIGIGGWQAPRAGVKVGRARGTTVMTVGDVERVGVEKIVETALELAWQGAKAVYLSFDIDVIDSGFVPGTGWPEPGGLLPHEALALVRDCARAACPAWRSSNAHRPMTGPSRPHSSVLVSYSTRWQVWYGWANSVTKRPPAPTPGGPTRAMHRATRPRIIPPATTRRGGRADQRLTHCRWG